ncbi:MAG: hypothetical protein KDL87_19730, partial [Verrucomicrobiae bacterium]|nr:hypothetical protein [Verrucomicrobiae bacterium]
MTSTEQLLSQAVATNPGDWGLRADLLAKQVERGGLAEANQTLLEAPVAVPDEAMLHRVTDLTGKLDECSAGIRQVLAWFIGANPESGFARLLQAQVTHHAGDHATALAQYRAAKKRDASLIDPHLDALHAAAVARIAAAVVPAAAEPTGSPVEDHPHVDVDGENRSIIVGEGGEMIHAHEKDSDTRAKISAVVVAVVTHIAALVVFGFLVIAQ